MSQLIDRRQNATKKNTVNRQRFLRLYKNQIKRALSDAIGKRSIKSIGASEEISIPAKDLSEPKFQLGQGGYREYVLPGNDKFIKGDHLERPGQQGGDGAGSEASNKGEGEDPFVFQLSKEEFFDLYFEGLELPHLVRKDLAEEKILKMKRAGVTNIGIPANINVGRSMRQAVGRKISLTGAIKKKIHKLKEELLALEGNANSDDDKATKIMSSNITALKTKIKRLKARIETIPFIDNVDLRYNAKTLLPAPATQAVMFCIMDVSGSMDEAKKNIAKRFFILLYLFLTKNYQKISIVFIRHHTAAKEVDEEEFFYSRETGGTVVSSALELLYEIIKTRFPISSWNIYVAQASDGDNWNADSPYCQKLLQLKIMPLLQYFTYIEIMPRHHQSLWEAYSDVRTQNSNFAMENINDLAELYPAFYELFKRK